MSSSPVTSVSFEDFRRDLIDAGGNAQQVYLSWRARAETRPDYKDVISFVEGFAHRFLFTITEEMLEKKMRRSEHALGDLKKEEAEDRRIEDFDTPFALHYLFHMYLEETCSVPTWQEWWAWLTEGNGKKFYIAKIQAYFDWKNLPEDEKSHLRDAVQWRVGKFYYSAFR